MLEQIIEILIGAALAILVGLFATFFGLDRDRAFYPVVTLVIASYYILFAIIGESAHALVLELVLYAVFAVAAVAGFKKSLWIVVVALAGHGVQDYFHPSFLPNPGVPAWWPMFCGTYDAVAAIYLMWLLTSGRVRSGD